MITISSIIQRLLIYLRLFLLSRRFINNTFAGDINNYVSAEIFQRLFYPLTFWTEPDIIFFWTGPYYSCGRLQWEGKEAFTSSCYPFVLKLGRKYTVKSLIDLFCATTRWKTFQQYVFSCWNYRYDCFHLPAGNLIVASMTHCEQHSSESIVKVWSNAPSD